MPRTHERLLPDGYAQLAMSARLENGALSPLRGNAVIQAVPFGTQSIYLHNGTWRAYDAKVSAAPGPIKNDFLYYTGDGAPKMEIDNDGTYALAIEQPTDALAVTANAAVDVATQYEVLFTYTFVTTYDEETAPAPVSDPVFTSPGIVMQLQGFTQPAIGRNINRMRIYRSVTSASGVTDLFLVDEIAVSNLSYNHDLDTHPIQEVIPTRNFDNPPDDLAGLVTMPNGMMAAFQGKALRFCEPYQPHAWPLTYEFILEYDIVAMVAFASTLMILTTGQPYIAQGTAPENITMEKIEVNYPCVSAEGVVDLGYSAIYPSNDGLVQIVGGQANIISSGIWTREQFQALNPTDIVASQHAGRYLMTSLPVGAASRETAILDIAGQSPFLLRDTFEPIAYHYDLASSKTYGLVGTNILSWDDLGEDHKTLTWRSKLWRFPSEQTMAAIKVEGTENDVDPLVLNVRVFFDRVLVATYNDLNVIDRLPKGIFTELEIEVETNAHIESVIVASTADEIVGV